MAIPFVWSNVFILLVAWCRLVGAACLDSTCASSPETDVGAKASLLQQNAVKAAPALAHQIEGEAQMAQLQHAQLQHEQLQHAQLQHSVEEAEEARFRAAKVHAEAEKLARYAEVETWDKDTANEARKEVEEAKSEANKKNAKVKFMLAGMKASLKFGNAEQEKQLEAKSEAKLNPDEEGKLGVQKWEALNLEDMRSLEQGQSKASKLNVEEEKMRQAGKFDTLLEEEDLRSIAAERLKAAQQRLRARSIDAETVRKFEAAQKRLKAANMEAETVRKVEELARSRKVDEAAQKRLKAAGMEAATVQKVEELARSKNAEATKLNAEKADALRKAQTEARLRAEEKAKAEARAYVKTLHQGSAPMKPETKPIAKPVDEKSAPVQNLGALKPQQIPNVVVPKSDVFVSLKSEREGAAAGAKPVAATTAAAEANADAARREVEMKAAAAALAARKAAEANTAATEAARRVVEAPTNPDPKGYVNGALIDRTHKVIMGWTPRAACTATVHMFFLSAGMYTPKDEQRFPWIHDYREALGDWVKPQIADMNNPKFTKFKIVRNPYTRAISNWGHQMETNFSYSLELQELAAQNGVSDKSTFLEWLKFVKNVGNFAEIGKERLDQHSWPQFSHWEGMGGRYDVIVQLEEPQFKEKIDKINKRHSSKLEFKTMHVSLAQEQNSPQRPSIASPFYNNTSERPPFASELYGVREEPRSPSHKAKQMYTQFPEAIKLVEEIYADDFSAYGYPKDVTKVYED